MSFTFIIDLCAHMRPVLSCAAIVLSRNAEMYHKRSDATFVPLVHEKQRTEIERNTYFSMSQTVTTKYYYYTYYVGLIWHMDMC